VDEKMEISLPSRIESVEQAASETAEFAKKSGFGDDVLFAIDMAVRESVANAVKHGNKFDETKSVQLTLSNFTNGFEITVRDFGPGFAIDEIPDPTNPENLLKASGRGILFMRSFMDEVEWLNAPGGGLVVKMTKKR
jgi:serine/threonine-protein kinase RsbW